jgi:hypothetical protein
MNKKIGISILSLVVVTMLFGPVVYAVDSLPSGTPITLGEIYDTMRFVATTIMLMSMVFAVIWFIWAGIKYMTAGEKGVEAAKKMFWNGVWGTAIILGVGVIIRTIAALVNRDFFWF